MNKILRISLFCIFVLSAIPVFTAVLTEGNMDFGYTVIDSYSNIPYYDEFQNDYIISHDFYTENLVDFENFTQNYSSSIPFTDSYSNSPSVGPNYAASGIQMVKDESLGVTYASLQSTSFAEVIPSKQYSKTFNHISLWDMNIEFDIYDLDVPLSFNLDVMTTTKSTIDGLQTDQISQAQYWVDAYLTQSFYDPSDSSGYALEEYSMPLLDGYYYAVSTKTTQIDEQSEEFSLDVSSLYSGNNTDVYGIGMINFTFGMDVEAYEYQAPVPEPATMLLLGSGLLGLLGFRKKRKVK